MQLFQISEPGTSKSDEFITKESTDLILGIDLGTTNSLIGYKNAQGIHFFEDNGSHIIPSIVCYLTDGQIIVGRELAKDSEVNHQTFKSIKRFMGKTLNSELKSHYQVIKDDRLLLFDTSIGPKTPTEISAEILKHLKSIAEKELGHAVSKVVISVPAYFEESARSATKDAARIAGLEVVRMISEPTAAAIAYGFNYSITGTYAVYDLGGGTFDVSILRMHAGILQVLSTSGDTNLGGNDFDLEICKLIQNKLGVEILLEEMDEALKICCDIKEYLSTHNSWSGNFFGQKLAITKSEFEQAVEFLINKTIDIFQNAIRDAQLSLTDLNEVILVGGATRMPCIKESLIKYIGKAPLDDLDPDKTVAAGAIMQAFNLQTINSNLLLDVIPLSLKIELANGVAETIIPRNTPIPAIRTQNFATQKDNQTGFVIHVLQGESGFVKECKSLANFELKGIPPMKAGAVKLEISFQIDADGLLSVKAVEKLTNTTQEILIKPSYGLNEEEIIRLIKHK